MRGAWRMEPSQRIEVGAGAIILAAALTHLILVGGAFRNLHLYALLLGCASLGLAGPWHRLPALRATLAAFAGFLALLLSEAARPAIPIPLVAPWRALGIEAHRLLVPAAVMLLPFLLPFLLPLSPALAPPTLGSRARALLPFALLLLYLLLPQALVRSSLRTQDETRDPVPAMIDGHLEHVTWGYWTQEIRPIRALPSLFENELALSSLAHGLGELMAAKQTGQDNAPSTAAAVARGLLWRAQRVGTRIALGACLLAPLTGLLWALLAVRRVGAEAAVVGRALVRFLLLGVPVLNLAFAALFGLAALPGAAGGLPLVFASIVPALYGGLMLEAALLHREART